MSRTFLLVLAFFALVLSASAHSNHARRNIRRARDIQASTCSNMQCAVKDGNCGISGSTLTFCMTGQHCNSQGKCVANLKLGDTCNPTAQENECAEGSCVDITDGPKCQIHQQTMPGNPCSHDTECWFSQTADGKSGSFASTCENGVCAGYKIGDKCQASHQCFVGSFCSNGVCKALGQQSEACNDDSECSSRFTCFSKTCTARYTQAPGQSCESTENCQPGSYCKGNTCAAMKTASASQSTCDVSSNSCPADEKCACQGFSGQKATCSNIQGTFPSMDTISTKAYQCMDAHACGSDMDNTTTISCIQNNCEVEYCTYITRSNNALYSDFPMCLVSRMVDSVDYAGLLSKCAAYKPTGNDVSSTSTIGNQNGAATAYLDFALALFVLCVAFLF